MQHRMFGVGSAAFPDINSHTRIQMDDAGEVAEAKRLFNERLQHAETELGAAAAGEKVPSVEAPEKLFSSIFPPCCFCLFPC